MTESVTIRVSKKGERGSYNQTALCNNITSYGIVFHGGADNPSFLSLADFPDDGYNNFASSKVSKYILHFFLSILRLIKTNYKINFSILANTLINWPKILCDQEK